MIRLVTLAAKSLIAAIGLSAIATADQLATLVNEAPAIVAVGILDLRPGVSINEDSQEFEIRAKVGFVAKGNLEPGEEIKVTIKLRVKDARLLRWNPFGMKKGSDFIFFLSPRFSADGKTLIDYRFTEIPLGCLGFDHYSWDRIQREIERANNAERAMPRGPSD